MIKQSKTMTTHKLNMIMLMMMRMMKIT